jgi:hypothetical protein
MRRGIEVAILTALILCSTGGCAQSADEQAKAVTLNPEHTVAFFPIDRETLVTAPPTLRISVTKVANPARTPVGIYIYLSPSTKGGEVVLVGDVALFPPDHPGSFLLGASKAFAGFRTQGRSGGARLKIELRRIHPERPWTPLEVTVAPPQWLLR